uniref:Uncharacterized protein n=1 Tax=Lepeophtheirus salmonis TaxID=72036 RepID=A0A0K2UR44_LEPSM
MEQSNCLNGLKGGFSLK